LRKVKAFAEDIAAHTRNKEVIRKLFEALKRKRSSVKGLSSILTTIVDYVLQWNGEAQSMTELFSKQNVEQLKTSLDKGQEKMKNELSQLADTLTEAVQQQLIEAEFREATILFLQDTVSSRVVPLFS
jgi:gas vesicle protein